MGSVSDTERVWKLLREKLEFGLHTASDFISVVDAGLEREQVRPAIHPNRLNGGNRTK